MSNVMELSLRGASNLEKLMRAVLLDSENKVPADRLRIVGALSAGNIIESGSNANGYYIRFADGTQMCCGTASVTIPASKTTADSDNAGTFPAAFISSPSVVLTGNRSEINSISNRFVNPSKMAIRIGISNAFDEAYFATISFFAIGHWKA